MKTNLFTLTFLLVSGAGFAQTAFTQATLNDVLAEYQANSKAFFTNRLSADFRYTTPKGAYQNRNDIVVLDVQKILKVEITDAVIFQSGDLAVVSGIHKTERSGPDGNPVMGQVACTYTFQKRQDKWMFVASQQTTILSATVADDEAAIKTVIEQESAAFLQCKADKVLSYWANVPYASHDYTEKGGSYLRGYEVISKAIRKYIGEHPEMATAKTVHKNYDYLIHVNGNVAWATFVTDALAGKTKSLSYNARFLEKMNGAWKLVSVTGKTAP